jgi:2-oxoglutarate dehydrogenase complex dehydrogenase (E1) component-like enzyme
VGQAVESFLKQQIGQTTDPDHLRALNDTLAAKAAMDAASSLAWAAKDDEAVEWAQALAALWRQANQDGMLTAMAYPTAAGPAAEILA